MGSVLVQPRVTVGSTPPAGWQGAEAYCYCPCPASSLWRKTMWRCCSATRPRPVVLPRAQGDVDCCSATRDVQFGAPSLCPALPSYGARGPVLRSAETGPRWLVWWLGMRGTSDPFCSSKTTNPKPLCVRLSVAVTPWSTVSLPPFLYFFRADPGDTFDVEMHCLSPGSELVTDQTN